MKKQTTVWCILAACVAVAAVLAAVGGLLYAKRKKAAGLAARQA